MTVPAFTVFAPTRVDVSGHDQWAVGNGFADVNAPKLTEVPTIFTCAMDDPLESKTDVKTKTQQRLCDIIASERIDTRTVTLNDMTIYTDGGDEEEAILAQFAVDKHISLFDRRYELSEKPLAVGDKGIAYSAVVSAIDPAGKAGEKFAYRVQFTEVQRSNSLQVALG